MNDLSHAILHIWQTHNRWLLIFGSASAVIGGATYYASGGVDGRDPFYVAFAMQFVIWGLIDALFGGLGWRDARATAQKSDVDSIVLTKADQIIRLLGFNRWLNVLWLAMGTALLAIGFWRWSSSLCGHGVGLFTQAIALTIADEIFMGRLRTFRPRRAAQA